MRVQARYFCNAMPWVDCTACRFHCTRIPDVDLCPEAFSEGRFPPGCSGKDFVKIDQKAIQVSSDLLGTAHCTPDAQTWLAFHSTC